MPPPPPPSGASMNAWVLSGAAFGAAAAAAACCEASKQYGQASQDLSSGCSHWLHCFFFHGPTPVVVIGGLGLMTAGGPPAAP